MQRTACARSTAKLATTAPASAPSRSALRITSADLELFRGDAEVDLDLAVDHPHRIRIHREDRRQRSHLAGREIESRAVAGTLHEAVFELALAEHAAVVRTDVVERAPPALLAMAETKALALRLDDPPPPRRKVPLAPGPDEIPPEAAGPEPAQP